MSGKNYYFNPGAVLRRLFSKQLKNQTMIIIWAVVFVINIVVAVLFQNYVIYNISDFSIEALQNHSYFKGNEILSIEKKEDEFRLSGDYFVTYKNEAGETRRICLDMFPVPVFERARLEQSSDVAVTENSDIASEESVLDVFWSENSIEKLAGVYIAIGVGMLLIEFFLYSVFVKLFRA